MYKIMFEREYRCGGENAFLKKCESVMREMKGWDALVQQYLP